MLINSSIVSLKNFNKLVLISKGTDYVMFTQISWHFMMCEGLFCFSEIMLLSSPTTKRSLGSVPFK